MGTLVNLLFLFVFTFESLR